MRDTLRLRTRLALLAALPAVAAGCEEPKRGRAIPGSVKQEPAKTKLTEMKPVGTAVATRAQSAVLDPPAPAKLTPEQARFEPIAGDPPYIDGYNPEEETCNSGNWCGPLELAKAIAPTARTPVEMACPIRIIGSKGSDRIAAEAGYKGLSSKKSMQGSLNQHGTQLARAAGEAGTCCYHWFEYCSGRPLLDGRTALVASTRTGTRWSRAQTALPPDPRDGFDTTAVGQAWLRDALAEHAAVAAFSRATLELLALGAPPDLVAGTTHAALDEIEHAQLCFSLAERFGVAREPTQLPIVPPRTACLARLAIDTFVEGCVGETIAAVVAARARRQTTDPAVARVLEVIEEQEAQHAALAWRTISWACREGGETIAAALQRTASESLESAAFGSAAGDFDPRWGEFGRLSSDAHHRARADAWRDIIGPMLEAVIAASRSTRSAPASV